MNATSEFLVRSMLIGAGATLTMDLWNAGVKRFGVPSAGIASSKTKTPVFNALKSLVSHVVFGFGLFLSARATVLIVSVIN